ncbi:MAG: DNA adenine methylase [Pirellulaceae bacterium]
MANDKQRAEDLRKNLRRLLRSEGLSQRQAAEKIGVRYKWMRRLCHHGLARIDRRTKASLEKVARFFKLEVADLWNPFREAASPAWVLIKWTGSKRKQAGTIVGHFPAEIETYYEPFVGSGAVLYRLLCSEIKVKRFRCSDICGPLIDLWNVIKTNPRMLLERYEFMCGDLEARGKKVYYEVRQQFNESGDPCQFFFLLRTCRMGFVRFTREGKFGSTFHLGITAMPAAKVKLMLDDWHEKLNTHDVRFVKRDYRYVVSKAGDFLYLDPPYTFRYARLYYGRFDLQPFFSWLAKQRGNYTLSLNGFVGGEDQTGQVPRDLYHQHFQIDNGWSVTRRINRRGVVPVTDSLYIKRNGDNGVGASPESLRLCGS